MEEFIKRYNSIKDLEKTYFSVDGLEDEEGKPLKGFFITFKLKKDFGDIKAGERRGWGFKSDKDFLYGDYSEVLKVLTDSDFSLIKEASKEKELFPNSKL